MRDKKSKPNKKGFNKGQKKHKGRPKTAGTPRNPNAPKKTYDGPHMVRLNKYMANSGLCSRREADDLIKTGAVTVNGKVVTELGTKIQYSDKVQFGDQVLKGQQMVYLLLNKPKNYAASIKAKNEEGEKTVLELIRNACKERIFPVGKMDTKASGLLLFTNNAELSSKLTHPKKEILKVYKVKLDKDVKPEHLEQLKTGTELTDGVARAEAASYSGEKNKVGIELLSNKPRLVQRMFESLGYQLKGLERVRFADFTKKELPAGHYRFLTEKEVAYLKML